MSTPATDVPEVALPTLDALGIKAADLSGVNASRVAAEWLDKFSTAVSSANVESTLQLITEDGFWRDFFSMTWEMRTFHTKERIRTFLTDRLAWSKITNVQLSPKSDEAPFLHRPYEDLAWVLVSFTFDTAVGKASAIARLTPSSNLDQWRAHTIFTNLEELHGHPETTGPLRERRHFTGSWSSIRAAESEFRNEEPAVLILGAGQIGLSVAARLKYLGIPALVVEKNPRVGDQWRGRYEALCLHDTVWYDHMPYLPFPSGWPVWAPAEKLADWLESYAKILDINVWTGSNVTQTSWDADKREWTITVTRNGEQRVFHPRHVVSAIGLAAGVPNVLHLPGEDKFKGKILHSTSFKTGRDYQGKKVLVIGAATSGHDVSADLYAAGVDVTMLQRSSTYIMSTDHGFRIWHKEVFCENGPGPDRSDRLFNAAPVNFLESLLRRVTAEIKEADADLLARLRKVGFQLDDGYRGSGIWINALRRGGGYYLDAGASELIAAGKIKLVTGTEVTRFTETGVEFADGRTLECDTVVYATGFGDYKDAVAKIFGTEVASKLGNMWGLNQEGEVNGVWRAASGHPGLYVMMGNLALSRFHSNHMALQIKAMEVGLYSEPYLK